MSEECKHGFWDVSERILDYETAEQTCKCGAKKLGHIVWGEWEYAEVQEENN